MGDTSKETSEVFKHYLKLSMPTEEDLKRVFTKEELKELCLKHKCRVDMWRWNVVDDYRVLFTASGRYQRWSERERLRMLAKAVNKIRPEIHREEDIRKTREEEWKFQLKDNILSLNAWKRRRFENQAHAAVTTQSDDINSEVQCGILVSAESTENGEMLSASEKQLENMPSVIIPGDKLQTRIEVVNRTSVNHEEPNGIRELTTAVNIDEHEDRSDDEDSVDTVMLKDNEEKEILQSEEIATDIEECYAINTGSLTINSEMSTQSQDLQVLHLQDLIAPNYDDFKDIIPSTSTQSQNRGTE